MASNLNSHKYIRQINGHTMLALKTSGNLAMSLPTQRKGFLRMRSKEKLVLTEFESLRRLMIWPQQKSHGREFLQITNLPGLSRDEGIVPSASGWKQFTRITKENEGSAICENSLKIVPAAFTLIVVFTLRTSYVKWID